MAPGNTVDAEGQIGSPWTPNGEFSWNHPSGWTITRYSVQGVRTYLLWDTDGMRSGPFDSTRKALVAFDKQAPTAATKPAPDEPVREDSNEH